MKWLKLLALIVLIFSIGVAATFIYLMSPAARSNGEKQDVVIAAGESRADISKRLAKAGIIRSSFGFFLYSKLSRATVLPGTYELSPSQSASSIVEAISLGRFKVVKITLIEGWRVSQMAEYLTEEKKLANLPDFAHKAQEFEGYLFPDTYEVKVDVDSDSLIKLLRSNFQAKTDQLAVIPETVILASIVEREAKSDSERPQIAQVYLNRQKIGMRLEADPTVQYAKGSWAAITVADYRSVISPYNTYLNDGLPPTPICSPGLKSIEAVLGPANHDYLYFFHAKGQTFFSKSLAEHRAKVRESF
ncbi:MAG: endolytic transglycosylase MltG [Patescibacteria group bacterium]